MIRREFRPGDILHVHTKDEPARTRAGRFVRRTRRYLVVSAYSIEAGGELHRMTGDELMIPHANIDCVERVAP